MRRRMTCASIALLFCFGVGLWGFIALVDLYAAIAIVVPVTTKIEHGTDIATVTPPAPNTDQTIQGWGSHLEQTRLWFGAQRPRRDRTKAYLELLATTLQACEAPLLRSLATIAPQTNELAINELQATLGELNSDFPLFARIALQDQMLLAEACAALENEQQLPPGALIDPQTEQRWIEKTRIKAAILELPFLTAESHLRLHRSLRASVAERYGLSKKDTLGLRLFLEALWDRSDGFCAVYYLSRVQEDFEADLRRECEVLAHIRLLLCAMEVSRHWRREGTSPSYLGQLVPPLKAKAIVDPFKGHPFVYSIRGENRRISSVSGKHPVSIEVSAPNQ